MGNTTQVLHQLSRMGALFDPNQHGQQSVGDIYQQGGFHPVGAVAHGHERHCSRSAERTEIHGEPGRFEICEKAAQMDGGFYFEERAAEH